MERQAKSREVQSRTLDGAVGFNRSRHGVLVAPVSGCACKVSLPI